MTVRVWSVNDPSNGALVASFPPVLHPMKVVRADLSPDGGHLAAALVGRDDLSMAHAGGVVSGLLGDGRRDDPAGPFSRRPVRSARRNHLPKWDATEHAGLRRGYGRGRGAGARPGRHPAQCGLQSRRHAVATASSTAQTAVERNSASVRAGRQSRQCSTLGLEDGKAPGRADPHAERAARASFSAKRSGFGGGLRRLPRRSGGSGDGIDHARPRPRDSHRGP